MLLKEEFFDDNKEPITGTDDPMDDLSTENENYQFSIQIKFNLNRNMDEINLLPNKDEIIKELSRLLRFIYRKYDIILSHNKHITDYRLSEIEERTWHDTFYDRVVREYYLTFYFNLKPFKDINEVFYFYDSLCFENYRFKSDNRIRWSSQAFFTLNENGKIIAMFFGEVTFNKISQYQNLVKRMTDTSLKSITIRLNEDFFDDYDSTNTDVENPDYDTDINYPVYDYTMEIFIEPTFSKDWNSYHKIISRLKYILESNIHIKNYSEPILCTDFTQDIINEYLNDDSSFNIQANSMIYGKDFLNRIKVLQKHYNEYTVVDRNTSKDSIGDQLMEPICYIQYIKFTFSHKFTKAKQLMAFYTSVYNTVMKYAVPGKAPMIGIGNNNTKRYKKHTSTTPQKLFRENGTGLEAQRLFDFMIPNYEWVK